MYLPSGCRDLRGMRRGLVVALVAAIALVIAPGRARAEDPPAPPPPGDDAKFYVAIEVTNQTARPDDEIDALIRGAMQRKLLATEGYAVAPKGETTAQGKKLLKARKLKGFVLVAIVVAPVYKNRTLMQTLRVEIRSYPERKARLELSPKATQSGIASENPAREVALMTTCAENAIGLFWKFAPSL